MNFQSSTINNTHKASVRYRCFCYETPMIFEKTSNIDNFGYECRIRAFFEFSERGGRDGRGYGPGEYPRASEQSEFQKNVV
jgi:hypothetical protein